MKTTCINKRIEAYEKTIKRLRKKLESAPRLIQKAIRKEMAKHYFLCDDKQVQQIIRDALKAGKEGGK